MSRYTKYLCKRGCRWVFVPDWDSHDGVHFHGLFTGPLQFTRARSARSGRLLFDNHHRPVYDVGGYKFGFTRGVPLDGSPAVITYLTEYYTKNRKNRKMEVPKGCKRYWASRNLNRPEISYDLVALETFLKDRFVVSNYTKEIESRFGDMILTETTEEDIMAYLEQLGRKEDSGTGPTQQNKDWVEVQTAAASPFCRFLKLSIAGLIQKSRGVHPLLFVFLLSFFQFPDIPVDFQNSGAMDINLVLEILGAAGNFIVDFFKNHFMSFRQFLDGGYYLVFYAHIGYGDVFFKFADFGFKRCKQFFYCLKQFSVCHSYPPLGRFADGGIIACIIRERQAPYWCQVSELAT